MDTTTLAARRERALGAGAPLFYDKPLHIVRGEGVHLFDPLRFCGKNSIVIYLAFFLPMAATRALLLKTGVIGDIGVVSLIVTAAGVLGALAIWWATRGTRLDFLFVRPARFWLSPRRIALQPAE